MDRRRTTAILDYGKKMAIVNNDERIRKVAISFDRQLENLEELRRVMDKTEWI